MGRRQKSLASILWLLGVVLAACGGSRQTGPSQEVEIVLQDSPAELNGTEWILTSLNGGIPVEGSKFTLEFPAENYLQGEAGCNSYGANYGISDHEFHLPRLHKTDLSCDAQQEIMHQEAAFFEALGSVDAFRATAQRLEFDNGAGEMILAFARKVPPVVHPLLLDTEWVLLYVRGEPPVEGSHLTLKLTQEGFGGFAGCNRYGGEYAAADGGSWAVSFVYQNQMECPTPALQAQEESFLEALKNAAAYRVVNERLEMDDAAGETLLAFGQQEQLDMNPADLPGTTWQLTAIDEHPIDSSIFTVDFHNDHRLGGYGGCNNYVATYQASGDDFNLVFIAMLGPDCPDHEQLLRQQDQYTSLLGETTDYRLSEDRLELLTQRGQVLLFEPFSGEANASLEDTTWELVALIEETEVETMEPPLPRLTGPLPETQITLQLQDGKASGRSGCNTYSAEYSLDAPSITWETVVATERACLTPSGVMQQESQYLAALARVLTFRIHREQLALETDDGRALVFDAQAPGYALGDLLQDLHRAGFTVELEEERVDHGFAETGRRLLVDGAPIFCYEFDDPSAAEAAAAGVSAGPYSITVTRSEGEVTIETHGDWVETPHLYKKGRLIVISGDHPEVLAALQRMLDPLSAED